MRLFSDLDEQLLRKYCAKPRLTKPHVFNCAFALSGTCDYLNALRRIRDRYGVNVVRRER